MNIHALYHKSKSEYAYAFDQNTLHLLIRTAKDDFNDVSVIIGDPFQWKNGLWIHKQLPMVRRYQTTLFDYYFVAYHSDFFRTKYQFLLSNEDGHYVFGARGLKSVTLDQKEVLYDLSNYFNYPYINHEDLLDTPTWVKDTVWYQIFPDRFANKDNPSHHQWGHLPVSNHELYGGNLKGIMERLPYLRDLGITGIYFTPIFKAPSAHKYDTADYFLIDPQFGTNEEFKQLVTMAHSLGIKIILDGVFNHAGYDHPFFQDVIKHGKQSIYKNAFYIKKFPVVNFNLTADGKPAGTHDKTDLNYLTFAFTPYMPKWNTSDSLAQKHLLDCVKYWIEYADIDGWRLDVSNEVSHDFLRLLRKAAKSVKSDIFIFGENWDSSLPWLGGDQVDSVMNYDWIYPVWQYFEHRMDLTTFESLMNNYLATTPKHVLVNMFNIVDSHDTIRIKNRLGEDARRVMLVFLFMFASAGAPSIYYGTEIGLSGGNDPDNRRMMPLDVSQHDMHFFLFLKQLIALRHRYPALSTPDYHFLDLNILAFYKKDEHDSILVLINNQNSDMTIDSSSIAGCYKNLMTQKDFTIYDILSMKPYDFYILKEC